MRLTGACGGSSGRWKRAGGRGVDVEGRKELLASLVYSRAERASSQ